MADLITLSTLRTASQRDLPDDSTYAAWVIHQASEVVLEAVDSPIADSEWDASNAPRAARRIALRMAVNAIKHPDSAIAETVGPLSERFLEEAVTWFVLTDQDRIDLGELGGNASSGNGLWVQPIGGFTASDPRVFVPDGTNPETADLIQLPVEDIYAPEYLP